MIDRCPPVDGGKSVEDVDRAISARKKGVRRIMASAVYEKGAAIRREVLGSTYVDKALAAADEFNAPLQELVTEYCWGAIWGRESLDRRSRSLINLAMISALNRPHELRAHINGALRNGLTKEEIREVLLQVAVYCGVPAGVDSFRVAREVFATDASTS